MTGYDSYNWTPFDTILNCIKGRGNHAIPRFYLGYPGWAPGTPGWLQGLTSMRSYNENGNNWVNKAPGWNDEDVGGTSGSSTSATTRPRRRKTTP
jgi:hypothetical protein